MFPKTGRPSAKLSHKDRHASWTLKFTKAKRQDDGTIPTTDLVIPFFGYKFHVSIDRKFRFIRKWKTTGVICRSSSFSISGSASYALSAIKALGSISSRRGSASVVSALAFASAKEPWPCPQHRQWHGFSWLVRHGIVR